jgi:hypothetical protein
MHTVDPMVNMLSIVDCLTYVLRELFKTRALILQRSVVSMLSPGSDPWYNPTMSHARHVQRSSDAVGHPVLHKPFTHYQITDTAPQS